MWQSEAVKDMTKAAEEERTIAIQNGNIDKNGVPCITVYLDGGWSKRSYGHNYNAASGVVSNFVYCVPDNPERWGWFFDKNYFLCIVLVIVAS